MLSSSSVRLLSTVCLLMLLASPAGADDFVPIFNGEDLKGWTGDETFWRVEDGAIVAQSTDENPCEKNTFLLWSLGEVDDFELKLKFRIEGSDSANSGVQIRSQVADDGHVVGYQADIDRAGKWLGTLYDEHGRGSLATRGQRTFFDETGKKDATQVMNANDLFTQVNLDGWNEYHITAQGTQITLRINGIVTAEVTDNDPENLDLAGVLALQLHSGPPMKVSFKEIELKRLPLADVNEQSRQKVVFIAGKPSHGYFSHEHNAGCLLLAKSLRESDRHVLPVVYTNGWPTDPTAFDNADTIVAYCDGGGGHYFNQRLDEVDRLMQRGIGLVCIHYAVEVPKGETGDAMLKWLGGYFEPFYSVNPHWVGKFDNLPAHAITRGVQPFEINDEWYYHMRFVAEMNGVTPILTDLPPRETLNRKDGAHSGNPQVREAVLQQKQPQHVAWAYERPDGGRSFGFTGGHFHQNWQDDNFRKAVLNGIVWTAKGEVPPKGVASPTPTQQELEANQDEPKPGKKPEKQNKGANKKSAAKIKPTFTSKVVTTQTPGHAVDIEADIKGAKKLYLVVNDGGNGFSCDWADWIEPKLVRNDESQKLTDLKWKQASTAFGEVRVNANAGGKPLRVDGQPVEDGIGTHANSVIEFELPKDHRFTTFQARGGLDEGGTGQGNCGESASVQFLVYVDKLPKNVVAASSSGGQQASHDLDNAVDNLDVADGLELSLFAGEPMMHSPSNMDIDHMGRVWICEVVNYRQFRNADSPEREAGDRILILVDTDEDGKADESQVFYQGRDIDSAHGVCVLGNRVIVSAGDSVFVLHDDDGDLKADRKEVLFTGISGTQHDHGIHSFFFGPDGKLYFNFGNEGRQIKDKDGQPIVDKMGNVVDDSRNPYQQGMVFRCNLDGSEFETLGWNFRNNWELAVDSFGTIWQSDNDDDGNRGVRINYVMEYGNYGYRDELTGAGWRESRTGWEEEIPERHWHLNDPGVVPNLLQTGAGSPTGICVYEGDLLPEVFRNQIIHCDAGPNIVRAYPVQKDGAGYTAEVVDLVSGTRDQWFRPSDVTVAPDGSVFIADWYDPGVGGHRMQDIQKGRVFRVAPPQTSYQVPAVDLSTEDGAVKALLSPNNATRYVAWQAIMKMGQRVRPALMNVFNGDNPRHAARAMWAIGKLPTDNAADVEQKLTFLRDLLQHDNADLRVAGIRIGRQLIDQIEPSEMEGAVRFTDPSAAVRRELLIALREVEVGQGAKAGVWNELANQYDGKDRWYLEALGIGAYDNWDACLTAYLGSRGDDWNDKAGRDIVWRSRADQTPKLLARLILDPATPTEELPRYFRAFDFLSAESKTPAIASLAGADIAGADIAGDKQRAAMITMEALARVPDDQLRGNPQFKRTVERMLSETAGTDDFIKLVRRFRMAERYPDILDLAIEHPEEQLGVDALVALFDMEEWDIIGKGVWNEDMDKTRKTMTVMGTAGDRRARDYLVKVMRDDKFPIDVRRLAVKSLGRNNNTAQQLIEIARSGKYDASLKGVIAATLHGSPFQEAKSAADELFPVPPAKDNEPLPSMLALADMRGDVAKGRIVFHSTGTCTKCHIVNSMGKEIGPNLSEIGKKLSRLAMFESLLYPSAGISHNYESYSVVTDDGQVFTGLIRSQDDQSVTIRGADGIDRKVKRSDIDILKKQDVSLMPADIQKLLSKQDLVDIVEYMQTLRKTTVSAQK